ncbi:MAG TPA: TetR/AcrR family transcriptional regulator [Vicinamibacterales bacterium]|nr:TetR/AcrR family transcriptional regulator [Vicinamibacterales bacterium]
MAARTKRATTERPFYVGEGDAPAKRRILETALELFVRDGLCETSVRDIARASGFTNPALFKHFKSKDELARYLFERCYLELAELVSRAIASETTFATRQRAIIDAYLAALDRDTNSVLYVQDWLRYFWPQLPDRVRRHTIVGDLRRLLESGRAEGRVTRDIDLDVLTAAWVGTVQQFARFRYFGEFKQPTRSLGNALEALLTRMVQP